jgi:ABC-type branched-subunit amino acid transport system substrate-binding protein
MSSDAARRHDVRPPVRSAAALALLALLLTGLAACRTVAPEVKIGLVGPFEGKNRPIGYDVIYSARLAVREINAAGGIGPYRVGLVALDDFGDPAIAVKNARALALDPQVVAVVGHWTEAATAAARPVYQEAGLASLAAGQPPLDAFDPASLPLAFRQIYAETTPFDKEAGPYAGPAYDAMYLLFAAMEQARSGSGAIGRSAVLDVLEEVSYDGVTGRVYRP